MEDGWRLQVAELKLAKRNAEALALIRQAIAEGDMSARVMLAKMGDEAGLSRSEVDALIDDIESSMDPRDIETHLQLRGAYDVGLGTPAVSASATFAIYSTSGQQFPLINNVYIQTSTRGCIKYEIGKGGAANAIFENFDCE